MNRVKVSRFNLGKSFITWLSVGILIGSGVGLFESVRGISSHRYLKYGMDNLAIYYLQSSLNKWVLRFFIIFMLGVIFSIVLRLGGKWVHKNIIAVQIVDRNRVLALFLSMLLSILFFFWYGPLILMRKYPLIHSITAFLRSIYDYLVSFFYIPMLLKDLLIVTISCLIIVGFGWILAKIRISDLLHSIGKILTSRWTTILTVLVLTVCGLVNVYAEYIIGRGGIRHKNVIMISVDTLRADHMGCYGYFRNTSPFMDNIAGRGIFFENAFTPWPITTPAVTSVFTGQYGHTNGITRITPYQYLENKNLLLAEILKNEGFSTEAIVTNINIGKSSNTHRGFDVFIDVPTADAKADAKSANKEAFKAVERLKQMQQAGKPFFLWIHYMDPHAPYKPSEFRNEFIADRFYDPNKHFTFRETLEKAMQIDQDKDISPSERLRRVLFRTPMGTAPPNLVDKTTTEVDYHVAMYDASIRFVDHQIGILLNRLKEEGLLEDSIIVLWADHGESLGDHNYYFDHGRFPYNSCLKIPFMIIHPEYQPRKINAPVSLLDLTPTLLDFLDIKRPLHFEGTSLVPLIDGKNGEQKEIFAESGFAIDFQKIMIKGDWKLIYIPDDRDRSEMQRNIFELYNLSLDPNETQDLSELNPQVLKEMKKSLFVWMDSWKESFMTLDGQDAQKVEYSKEDFEKLRSLGYAR